MRSKKFSYLLLIVALSFLPLFNLFTPGLPITHDGLDHVVRIANFYDSLTEGVLIPRWAENLNWGYGHPILMFLYPLPSYLASFIHFLGFPFVESFKIVLGLSYILSGIFMFLWIRNFLGEKAALVGSILYLFAPYRFVDLYVRGAIGEHVAFLFIPLVLYFLLKLDKIPEKNNLRKKYLLVNLAALSIAGLILSHNAISLLFFPFAIFYILFLFYQNRSRFKLLINFISVFLGLLFSFFFWFPAYWEGKYTLRDIVTAGEYANRFVDPFTLLYSPWSFGGSGFFSVQIGIAHIALFLISFIFFVKLFKKTDHKLLYLGTVVFFVVSTCLMLKESNFIWEKITTLQKLQFPWRFLSIVVLTSSLIGSLFVESIKQKYKTWAVILVIIVAIISTFQFWHPKEYKTFDESFFTRVYPGTTDTGESAPIWSVRFMEKFPKDSIEIIDGTAEIKKIRRTSSHHEYLMDISKRTRIRENTLYFPGWKVYDNGREIQDIEFQDPKNRGLITFYLEPGLHNVILKFEDTKVRSYSNLISLVTIIFIIIIPATILLNSQLANKIRW